MIDNTHDLSVCHVDGTLRVHAIDRCCFCAAYPYANHNERDFSHDDWCYESTKAVSGGGGVEGRDCTWTQAGYLRRSETEHVDDEFQIS